MSLDKRIVIVGGGLAGWASAAFIAHSLKGSQATVAVLELADMTNLEPVQATLPSTLEFFRHLGVDEDELVRRTGAGFRLGTEHANWPIPGTARLCGFGPYGSDIGVVQFHQFASKLHLLGDTTSFDSWSPSAIAAINNRFVRTTDEGAERLPPLSYGLHLNTDKLVELLRANAGINGVVNHKASADAVNLDANGQIASIMLDDGTQVDGDWFIDCSGDRAFLIGEALHVELEDWSKWLPCDRTVSLTTMGRPKSLPVLRTTPIPEGWLVQSILRHRTAHQVLYSSEFVSDETATAVIKQIIGETPSDALTIGQATSGLRKQCWAANCIAIGAAAGHVESLDVSSLHLIQSGLRHLMQLFPGKGANTMVAREYNSIRRNEFESLRDFTMMSYVASTMSDGPFWQLQRELSLPDSLKTRLALFKSRGRLVERDHEVFDRHMWTSLFFAAEFWPSDYDPLLDATDTKKVTDHFSRFRSALVNAVSQMPTHDDYLNRFVD